MEITGAELRAILELHLKWLKGEEGGVRANLVEANLEGANLGGENLQEANLEGANLRGCKLEGTNLEGANLWGADLRGADLRWVELRGVNLQGADLQGADLDFSSWPLCCGSRGAKVSLEFVHQLLAHVAVLDCEEEEYKTIRGLILPYARKCHRAKELGLVEVK